MGVDDPGEHELRPSRSTARYIFHPSAVDDCRTCHWVGPTCDRSPPTVPPVSASRCTNRWTTTTIACAAPPQEPLDEDRTEAIADRVFISGAVPRPHRQREDSIVTLVLGFDWIAVNYTDDKTRLAIPSGNTTRSKEGLIRLDPGPTQRGPPHPFARRICW